MKKQFSNLVSKVLTLTILASVLPYTASAQSDAPKDSYASNSFQEGLIFSGAIGYNSYFGDLTEDVGKNILPFDNESQVGFSLGIHKELIGFLELGVKGMFGKVQEVNTTKRPSTRNVYSFNSNVSQVGLNLNLNVVNLIRRDVDNKFAFLISAGYGITSYKPKSSIMFPGGETADFPANLNPDKGESSTEGTLNYGLGLRYRVNHNWAVGLEANVYTLSADNLDAWSVNSSGNDSYSFMGISINYRIRKNKVGNPKLNKDKTPVPSETVEVPVSDAKKEEAKEVAKEVVKEIPKEVVEETPPIVNEIKEEVKEKVTSPPPPPPAPKLTANDFKDDMIYFGLNENKDSDALNKQISAIASKLKKHPKAKIVLAGYTDKSGSVAYNNNLSAKRASWVKNMLVSKYNISSSRISTVGEGTKGATKEIEPSNRRVEVIKVN